MITAGIDVETTGFLQPDHRIVEVYIGLWKGPGRPVFEFEQRVNPERGIPAEATRVHGITASDVMHKPIWSAVAPTVVKILQKADQFVWHNGDEFDGPFLSQELKRVDQELPKRPSVDTMLQGIWATPDGKKPSLAELCFACGIPYDPALAHAAPYDVRDTMMPAYFRALEWGFYAPERAAA